MTVYDDLLQFSAGQEAWLGDLIRRAITQTRLTDQDLQEIKVLIKSRHQPQEEKQSALGAIPLKSSHFPSLHEDDAGQVTLKGLLDVMNVDRLVPNQSLLFTEKGITIVYGDNGSGKSGYCRILKQLCRARQEQPEQILGDAFAPGTKPTPTAKIEYEIDSVAQPKVEWVDNIPQALPAELSRITVFDASAAPLYADKQNEIEFLPRGLDVLGRVGEALTTIGKQLDGEIVTLESATGSAPLNVSLTTAAGKFLQRLTCHARESPPSADEIDAFASWGEKQDRRLTEVQKKIGDLTEPERIATQLRLNAKSIENLVNGVEATLAKIDAAALQTASEALSRLHSAREAAKLAAEKQFAGEPLGHAVGTDPWRRLFEYAREFSAQVYPGEPFPVVGPGKFCPLCQQPLTTEASERLIRFEQFVENLAQQNVETAQTQYNTLYNELTRLTLPRPEDLTAQLAPLLGADDQSHNSLADKIVSFYQASRARLSGFQNFLSGKISADAVPACPVSLAASLRAVSTDLNDKAAGFEATKTDRSQIEQLQSELRELEAGRALNQNLSILKERRAKLGQLELARICRKSCDTRTISLKNNELRDKYLTKEMKQRVRNEIAGMGLGYLPLRVDTKTAYGTSMMGVALEKSINVKTSRILSEGEFRALALACFFAEVDSIPGQNGIIVDDPVSSLDHTRMRQVARRIVEEASKRQVIVFTHDLPFYYDLWEAAGEKGVAVARHQLLRETPSACGQVVPNDAPWQAKDVKERLAVLEGMLNEMPDPAKCSVEEHWRNAEDFYVRLRETLERFVEEKLLKRVVSRFQSGVQTLSLKEVIVDDSDYSTIFWKMRKASTFSAHDTAIARQTSPPTIEEMRKDIQDIRTYEKELNKRQEEVKRKRKLLEEPQIVQAGKG
jgi:energy-coupling factor transporter ATP-binding protein EcfA2